MQLKTVEEELEEGETMTVEFVAFISSRPVLKTTNWVSPVGGILISSDRKFSASPAGQLERVERPGSISEPKQN